MPSTQKRIKRYESELPLATTGLSRQYHHQTERSHAVLVTAHPILIAANCIYLTIVCQYSKRLCQLPSRHCIGRITLVVNSEGRDKPLV